MKKGTSFTFLFFAIIVVGCSISSPQKTKDIDVRVGFNGLVPEFSKNTPPVKMFENDIFPVILKVRNNGASDIKKENNQFAYISLGIEKDYTKQLQLKTSDNVKKVSEASAMFNLDGKTSLNPTGDLEVISYELKAGNVDPQSEAHSSTVIATVCYPYQTILATTVCIDTDISNTKPGKKVCTMQDLTFSNGQGAPVAIPKIEVSMLPAEISGDNQISTVKPQFLIYIENKDKGNVIKYGYEREYCTNSQITHENLNKIYVTASLGGTALYCPTNRKEINEESKDGYVKLVDKKAVARCFLKEQGSIKRIEDNYLTPLKITLAYGYTQSLLANYFIQKATGQ